MGPGFKGFEFGDLGVRWVWGSRGFRGFRGLGGLRGFRGFRGVKGVLGWSWVGFGLGCFWGLWFGVLGRTGLVFFFFEFLGFSGFRELGF